MSKTDENCSKVVINGCKWLKVVVNDKKKLKLVKDGCEW